MVEGMGVTRAEQGWRRTIGGASYSQVLGAVQMRIRRRGRRAGKTPLSTSPTTV